MKMTNKNEWKKLADKYLQQDKEQTIKVWNKIEELDLDSAEKLLNTPELVKLYISKYRLYSSSVENKLLNTPELVKLYISKYYLCSSSAEKLLNTPELVKLYINKYEINGNLKKVIINFSSN